ncbi:M56 family metallopeptidase [Gilvibacter sediminis]|uniref:M56 family metallopeptidase n=1 Tax=Gilvibacter sediminis TaxID=379071 RepID=UPI00235076AA|nr:M56 family metallopeptidase [Gilvibacter sediminis]MDC7999354.1 M56 family metallopeptidase [Gilvibacter sediminis]
MELFYYLIKSASILGLFYVVYWFALRRHTWFIANRQYLIFGILAALLLPLVEFTQTVYVPAPDLMPSTSFAGTPLMVTEQAPVATAEPFDWVLLAVSLYLIGCLAGLIRFSYQSWSLLRVLKQGNYEKHNKFYYVKTNQNIAPFSFFKYLVYNPELHSAEELEMILQHERAHAQGWHSVDVLLSNLLTIVHWLNPVAWLYKKSIIQNLEYIADQQTVREVPSKTAYQLALVKASTGAQHLALSNSFYQSFIKNRIVMLNANQSRKIKKWRLLLILPLLVGFMYSFNVNTEVAYLENEEAAAATAVTPSFLIDKFSTQADIDAVEAYFASNHPEVTIEFSKEKWIDNTLTAYQMEVNFPQSTSGGGKLVDERTDEAVIPRLISFNEGPEILIEHPDPDRQDYIVVNEEGLSIFDPEIEAQFDEFYEKSQENSSAVQASSVVSGTEVVNTTLKVDDAATFPDYLFIINEKPWISEDFPEGKVLTTPGYLEFLEPEEGIEKFGQTGADGVVVVHGKASFVDENLPNTTGIELSEVKVMITANMTRAELDEKIAYLSENYDIELVVEQLDYNADGMITQIEISYSRAGNSGHYSINNDDKAIDDIVLIFGEDGSMSSMSGGNRADARLEARKAAMEARKTAMEARKLARADMLEARKAEMEARKAEMKALREAREAELATMSDAQRAEMEAKVAELKAREKALAAEQRALARTSSTVNGRRASGYARRTNSRTTATVSSYGVSDVYITKNTTDAELEQIKKELAAEGVSFTFKRVRRNAAGQITGIKIILDNNKGSRSSTQVSGEDNGIDDIHLEY